LDGQIADQTEADHRADKQDSQTERTDRRKQIPRRIHYGGYRYGHGVPEECTDRFLPMEGNGSITLYRK
jgi:hypothetical protein